MPPKDRVIKSHIKFQATGQTWCGQPINQVQFIASKPSAATCLNCLKVYAQAQKRAAQVKDKPKPLPPPSPPPIFPGIRILTARETWGLVAEKRYLDGLGAWGRNVRHSRKELLISYRNTIHLRPDAWVSKARDYAIQLLRHEYGI